MKPTYVKVWRVDLIESERGWGSRVDETREFPTLAKAQAFVKKFNAKNNEATVPDWYMYATEPREAFVKAQKA